MLSQALLAPPAIFQLPPPYDHFEAVIDSAALSPEQLPDAALLAVPMADTEQVWNDLAALAAQLHARVPAAPLVLRAGTRTVEAEGESAQQAERLGIRSVVFEGEPIRAQLQRSLTDPAAFAEDLPRWLALRLPGVPTPVTALITELVLLSPRYGEVSALLASLGHAERTVRTWFRRAGVPGPGKWLAMAHCTRAALRMQAEPTAPLLALAVECGYSDHSSLSRQCLRLFGVRPGRIRGLLGWEWLVDRWLKRTEKTERKEMTEM
jgi:AraC-like DNA-binding protein